MRDNIEDAGYFYSTMKKDTVIGISLIGTQYFVSSKEYPVVFIYYRKNDELQKPSMHPSSNA
nr:hypothetical protein [Candidatus Sigynarchaeota archaeon]